MDGERSQVPDQTTPAAPGGRDGGSAPDSAPAPAAVAPAFVVEVQAIDRASYAMAHNRQPAVSSVRIHNERSTPGQPLTVAISSRWAAAEHPPLRPESFVVECPAVGDVVELSTTSCRLDDAAMALLDETAPARVQVSVSDEAGNQVAEEREMLVLARNQWNWDLPAMTASFVQPHHPAIPAILQAAGAISAAGGFGNAVDGYQSDAQGAIRNARAVFHALHERIPMYIDPPASFDKEGQKVRPLDQVLAEKQGTCVDLACAYASCLQQAGLNTVIVLVHGHAFPCFFTFDHFEGGELPTDVVTDVGTVRNLVDQGLLVPVEPTLIPAGGSFEQARTLARGHLNDWPVGCKVCTELAAVGAPVHDHPHLVAAVDVRRCFVDGGIRSLPVRMVEGDVVTVVIDNGPNELPVTERRDVRTNRVLPRTVPARVQQWKNSLLDLSLRNRLLNFNAPAQGIALMAPSGSLGEIEDHLVAGNSLEILDESAISEVHQRAGLANLRSLHDELLRERWARSRGLFGAVSTTTLQARAKTLMRRAKQELQETAVNNLNLALGSVRIRGAGSRGKDIVAPVFLVPVSMTWNRGRTAPVITMDPAGLTTPNYCLLEWLRAKQGLALEWFRGDMRDDTGMDVLRGLDELRREVLDAGVSDRITVEDDAAVAVLRFDKIRLWKDLEDHWQDFTESPVVGHLVTGAQGGFRDPANREGAGSPSFDDTTLRNPMPADGAQTAAVVRSLAGHSFILEGPPGTGKSQTITNLLANALANGRKVLFVAQKQPALTVVKERLHAAGLDPFCLDLHDKGSTMEQIKVQLRDALDFTPSRSALNRWEQVGAQFDVVARSLETYRARLHEPTAAGPSFAQAHRALLELGEGPTASLGRSLAGLPEQQVAAIRHALLDLPSFTTAARPTTTHPWRFASTGSFDAVNRDALARAIEAAREHLSRIGDLDASWRAAVDGCPDTRSLMATGSALAMAERRGPLPGGPEWRAIAQSQWYDGAQGALSRAAASLARMREVDSGLPPALLADDLGATVDSVRAASVSFPIGRKGRVRRALGDLADRPKFSDHRTALSHVESLHGAGVDHRAARAQLAVTPGLAPHVASSAVLDDAQLADLGWWVGHLASVASVLAWESPTAAALTAALGGGHAPRAGAAAAVLGLATAIDRILAETAATEESMRSWTTGRSLIDAAAQAVPAWRDAAEDLAFVTLRRWCDLVAHVSVFEEERLRPFRTEILDGTINGEQAATAFERALLAAVLRTLGEDYQFDVFDRMAHDRLVERFTSLLDQRQRLVREVTPAVLHESRTFDSTSTIGAVGALRTELNSRRRGARSIRALISRYPDLISQLAPCFLMGPDSVAKFLEPGTVAFDLVVFDEASQITVPDAIGAMGRAGSVVIVGDSKQMPPTSAFTAGAGTEEDDILLPSDLEVVPEDADSILEECVESGLPRQMLSWHYRSQDEVLIAFSNEHYYEGNLASFPAPDTAVPDCGIVLHRVNGQFDHGRTQTNQIEADAIVAEIRRRVKDPSLRRWSIGVVTLNLPQANLVRDQLSALQDPEITDLLETDDADRELFVLNLESVQGRERDVIILGTSFSKRANGDPMPLNFGPLNQNRGERRLNVAVTRARRQVVVFSSFDPEELAAARAVGMIHLREYLELARKVGRGREHVELAATQAPTDPHTSDVADALRARGLIVREHYGLSSFKVDLAVTLPEHQGRWLVAVLLDGPEWGRRRLALDRDALPLTVLRDKMGWPTVARVWLPAWRSERDDIVSQIHDLAHGLAQEPAVRTEIPPAEAPPTEGPRPPGGAPTPEGPADARPTVGPASSYDPTASLFTSRGHPLDVETAAGPAAGKARAYREWEPPLGEGSPETLDSAGATIRRLLVEAADVEGPIPVDAACRKVARAFGLERVRANRLDQISRFAPEHLVVRTPFGQWLYPAEVIAPSGQVSARFDWYRTKMRKIQDIAPHEIENALVETARAAHRISPAELAAEALTVFGYARRPADAVTHVRAVIDWAVERGSLVADGDALRAP